MYMFKYISEIIKNFTQGQRIIALLIVVLSIILIVLGPSIINIFDEKDVKELTKEQRDEIISLNKQIIDSKAECTTTIVQLQDQIITDKRVMANQLDDIRDRIKSMEYQSVEYQIEEVVVTPIVVNDSCEVEQPLRKSISQPKRKKKKVKLDFSKVLTDIDSLKVKLK
jgi:hypothetical protein